MTPREKVLSVYSDARCETTGYDRMRYGIYSKEWTHAVNIGHTQPLGTGETVLKAWEDASKLHSVRAASE